DYYCAVWDNSLSSYTF
nr:immunoglobulin light chain junction region [Macaca mulatta]MOV94438.1 immunoglobulin light chain junction region [Macaca mulatta]MOV94493.1 immunoglobulin light chain junction region [Macaca mulatta]MOV94680.1 immunoglobulin light chain junction region [Macaca mulatta]MOV96732.1 immunoglobulin light chain junction region [Macaca mulatta]